jgi:hypothetical protein
MRLRVVHKLTVVMLKYLDCTTYEGNKVLVYATSKKQLKKRKKLDPHFLEHGLSPIARFPGNDKGFKHAVLFAKAVQK